MPLDTTAPGGIGNAHPCPCRCKSLFKSSSEYPLRSTMKARQIVGAVAGAVLAALGLLWFLQGVGLLRIQPIFCVANCEEIVGPSPVWAGVGAIALVIGVLAIVASVKRG